MLRKEREPWGGGVAAPRDHRHEPEFRQVYNTREGGSFPLWYSLLDFWLTCFS